MEEAKLLLEANVIKFCDTHKLDLLPSSCSVCKLVSRTVKAAVLTELVKLMKAKAAASSDIPAAAEGFATRVDEKSPILTFSDSDMSLLGSLFGRGKMALPSL